MILDKSQAEAVHAALLALGAVAPRTFEVRFSRAIFTVGAIGSIEIYGASGDEYYVDAADFARAYGLTP